MQVFDLFFKVLKKKYVAALVFIVVFLVISYGLSNSEDHTTEFTESVLDVAVMDEDGTEQSKALTEFIGKKHRIKNVDSDRENMTELLYWEEVDYILVIKKGFAGNLARRGQMAVEGSFPHILRRGRRPRARRSRLAERHERERPAPRRPPNPPARRRHCRRPFGLRVFLVPRGGQTARCARILVQAFALP